MNSSGVLIWDGIIWAPYLTHEASHNRTVHIETFSGRVKKKRRFWVRPYIKMRKERGDFYITNPDMLSDREFYFETFRMTPETFEDLLNLFGPRFVKLDSVGDLNY
ncbi:unnamed protein product [Allacma fusca]|uniref:Uncharacterized protein n=1 Tax=Allacma fusca TaxID=39272 RepID=A0A8J2PNT8_9HEXA|nr:unnamed protein product [Allacma fusca]